MLAQTEGLSAIELAERLELDDLSALRPWTARLLELDLIKKSGNTTAMRYFVPPTFKRAIDGLVAQKQVEASGSHRWRTYRTAASIDHGGDHER